MEIKLKSSSPLLTTKIGKIFGQAILEKLPKKQALILGLKGKLGSGKTTFAAGLIKSFGIKRKITSPTFLLMKKFFSRSFKKYLYHFDFYRLNPKKDLKILGFEKITKNPQNIILIEWPEKIKKWPSKNIIWIHFNHSKKINERIITIRTK